MAITSAERESGKTRLLEVTELLVREPIRAASMSPAALYTKISESVPTLLLDEMDAVFGPKAKNENEELRGLLNAGNRRGATTIRCIYEKGKRSTEKLSVFCPRALAGIGNLPETIESRSIVIRLKRKTKLETVERLGPRELKAVRPEAELLRSTLQVWSGSSIETLTSLEPTFPPGLRDRQEESAEPLLAIADLAGADWPDRARRSIVELCTGTAIQESSLGERILRDCKTVFEARADFRPLVEVRIFSDDLRSALCGIEEAPWATWNRGKEINPRGLAQLLKPYDIESRDIRIGQEKRKGFEAAWFFDAWERYLGIVAQPLPEPPNPRQARQINNDGPFLAISHPRQEPSVSDRREADSSITTGIVSDVSDKSPMGGGQSPPEHLAGVSHRDSCDDELCSGGCVPEAQAGSACGYFCGGKTSGLCERCRSSYSAHLGAQTPATSVERAF